MKHPSVKTQLFRIGLALLLVFSIGSREVLGDDRPTNPAIGPNTIEILPYGSDYGFQIPPDPTNRRGFAPFRAGGGGGPDGKDCPYTGRRKPPKTIQSTVGTPWPFGSEPVPSVLLIRRQVSIPPGVTGVRVMVSVDNDILEVSFNGTSLREFTLPPQKPDFPVEHQGCAILDEFRFDVPQDAVDKGSPALVVIRVQDRGVESFFDARILAETCSLSATFGCEVNGQRNVVCIGTSGRDTIRGTDGNDVIYGLGGDDQINSFGGDDLICGGDGNDTLVGGDGNDTLVGQADNDSLFGQLGADILAGGPGKDLLVGHDGNDILNGGDDNDSLFGKYGDDFLDGGAGVNNDLNGGPGDDFCINGNTFNCERP